MFAATLFGRFSLTLFSFACACEDFLYQIVPRRFFELLPLLELGFYLWRLLFVRAAVPIELLFSLCLSLPLFAFSLLPREAPGPGNALFLLYFGPGADSHRLLPLLTVGFLSTTLLSLFLLCRHFGRPKKAKTERTPLLPFFLFPVLLCLLSPGKALS